MDDFCTVEKFKNYPHNRIRDDVVGMGSIILIVFSSVAHSPDLGAVLTFLFTVWRLFEGIRKG